MPTRLTEVTQEVLALPPADRLTIALTLWDSLGDEERAKAFPADLAVLAVR